MNENGHITKNKAKLVAQGYSQEEGIDFEKTYAPVAWLEVIRILLAFSVSQSVKLFQMDVKSAFLNRYFKEKVYVEQPPGLKIISILTMCSSSTKYYTDWSKSQEYGTNI